MLLHPGRFEVLVVWVVALVAASGYLIGLEYLRESLRERAGIARMNAEQLMALARTEGVAGEKNDSEQDDEKGTEKNSEAAR